MGLFVVSKNVVLRDAIKQLCEVRNIAVSGVFNSCADAGRISHGQVILLHLDGEVPSISHRLNEALDSFHGMRCVALVPAAGVKEIEKSFGDRIVATVSDSVGSETLISILALAMGGYTARLSTDVAEVNDFPVRRNQPLKPDKDRSIAPLSDVGTDQLSSRELAVMSFLRAGYSNKAIGRALGIQDSTVKAHLRSSFRRIGARNRTQAAMWAVQNIAGEDVPLGD